MVILEQLFQVFPHYFAILSRVKEEVRAMGQDGGKITVSHTPSLQVYFPPGALQKRIKVAMQVQTVPNQLIQLLFPKDSRLAQRQAKDIIDSQD